jgi:integrase/recombinase XerD
MKLSEAIVSYVNRRHLEGSTYINGEAVLRSLCKCVGDIPLDRMSASDVIRFLYRPEVSSVTQRGQYSMVNRFLQFWAYRADMPSLIIPPPPRLERTFVPHIYSSAQIRALLAQCVVTQANSRFMDGPTLRNLLLSLYATGAHVGEVRDLRISDLDRQRRHLVFRRESPTMKRRIPINADLTEQLSIFLKLKTARQSEGNLLFTTLSGQPLNRSYLNECFRRLQKAAGVARHGKNNHAPRMQDLRATFAVHRLTSWIKQGADLNRLVPALSAYMGFSGLASSEKYLSLTPERFRRQLRILSPQCVRKHWREDPGLMLFLCRL